MYEFVGQNPAGLRDGRCCFRSVSSWSLSGCFTGIFRGRGAPVSISVETFPKASIPGTELDVPRLAAPRGPARGRARANLRDLTYRSSSTIAASARRAVCHAHWLPVRAHCACISLIPCLPPNLSREFFSRQIGPQFSSGNSVPETCAMRTVRGRGYM